MTEPVIPLNYEPASIRPRLSGHLIGSVLLSTLVYVPLLSAAGAWGLARVGKRHVETGARRGPTLVRAAMILVVFNLIMAPLAATAVVSYVRTMQARTRNVQSMANLRALSQLVIMYSVENHGFYPADLDVLSSAMSSTRRISPSIFRSPAADPATPALMLAAGPCDYIYVPPADQVKRVRFPAAVPVIYESPADYGNARTAVAFADGHVELVSGARMTTLVAQVNANKNPPGTTSQPSP